MTDEKAQRALRTASQDLNETLARSAARLEHLNDVDHYQHSVFAQRAESLGRYLRAAVSLSEQLLYPQAFALLRSALEHHFLDRLLFFANRYEQVTDPVDEDTWRTWQQAPPIGVIDWTRQANGRVRITWRGVVVDGEGSADSPQVLSIYYLWLQEYDPFAVHAADLDRVAAGHPVEREDSETYAASQRDIWRDALSWRNIKSNLLLNSLADERFLTQLDIHYSFLSAFVHPNSHRAAELAYPRNTFSLPVADHYSDELVLLYSCYLAAEELRALQTMTENPPRVTLRNSSGVEERLSLVDQLIEHGWLPGRPPFLYDRVLESNQRAFDEVVAGRDDGVQSRGPPAARPETVPDNEVRYYSNPLTRLVALHQSFQEVITGLAWISPWRRTDADYR